MVLTEKNRNLTQRQIDELFEIVGLDSEAKRQHVLDHLSFLREVKKGPIGKPA